jgi:signal peptidase I
MEAPAEKPAPPQAKPPLLREFVVARRGFAALAMLVCFEIVPAFGLALALQDGSAAWTALAVFFMGACALPALGVWRGQRWAFILAAYVAWINLVGIVIRALSTGEILLHLPFAGFCGLLIASLESARPVPAGAPAQERRPDSVDQWVRENLEAIVIAFIMALVIRCFCIEVFKIPSSSMEPTLLGDNKDGHVGCAYASYHLPNAPGGDRIMVTKFFYSISDIQRFDVLVFKFPLNQPRNFIKRVVGLPDEKLRIYKGNLFVQKPGEEKFAIARRTLRTQDSIWIDPIRGHDYFEDLGFFLKHWEPLPLPGAERAAERLLQDHELRTEENRGVRGVRFNCIKPPTDGPYGAEVGELRLAFEFELTSPKGEVFAEIANEFGRFELTLSTDRASRLDWTRPKAARETERRPLEGFQLEMDRRYRLDLSVYDGRAVARIDGKEWCRPIDYLNFREDPRPSPEGEIGLSFGSRDATFRVRKLSIGRDIYYKGKSESPGIAEDEPIRIEPGHYVMMGDNVDSSHDSRSWKIKKYLLKDGRTVECEWQEVNKTDEVRPDDVQRRYGVDQRQDTFIAGDRNGTPWLLYDREPEKPLPAGLPVGVIDRELP